jgi:hypothetical protein
MRCLRWRLKKEIAFDDPCIGKRAGGLPSHAVGHQKQSDVTSSGRSGPWVQLEPSNPSKQRFFRQAPAAMSLGREQTTNTFQEDRSLAYARLE